MATYENLDYGSPDGSLWGRTSTEKLGMYGVTPVTQYTAVGSASTYLTYKQSTNSASTFGFASALEMTSFIMQISTITVALRRIGLVL